jgi:hypothetical protein
MSYSLSGKERQPHKKRAKKHIALDDAFRLELHCSATIKKYVTDLLLSK